MAWTVWIDITSQDFMSIDFIAQVYENQTLAAADISEYLHRAILLLPIDTARGSAQQPFPEYLNLVEENLNRIYQAVPWNVDREPSRTWLGEQMDVPTFRYSDVNRWFRDTEALKITVDYVQRPQRISGTFAAGAYRQPQVIRRRQ